MLSYFPEGKHPSSFNLFATVVRISNPFDRIPRTAAERARYLCPLARYRALCCMQTSNFRAEFLINHPSNIHTHTQTHSGGVKKLAALMVSGWSWIGLNCYVSCWCFFIPFSERGGGSKSKVTKTKLCCGRRVVSGASRGRIFLFRSWFMITCAAQSTGRHNGTMPHSAACCSVNTLNDFYSNGGVAFTVWCS